MSRFIKVLVFAAVSLVLLYYNVAWAVLRCPHEENHPDLEVVSYDAGLYAAEISHSGPSRRQLNLDCTGPNYHTELLAGPSSTSELLRLTREIASRANVFFGLSRFALDLVGDIWRIALSHNFSSASLPFALPRYLSLSVFRF